MAASAAAGAAADHDAAFRARLPGAQKAAKAAAVAKAAVASAAADVDQQAAATATSAAAFAAAAPTPRKRKHAVSLDLPDVDSDEDAEDTGLPSQAKKARAVTDATSTGTPSDKLQCMVCFASFTHESIVESYYCPSCEMIYTAPEGSVANQRRAAKLGLLQHDSAASSSVHSSQLDTSSSTAKPKLGAYEAELKRLLDHGGHPLPRFQLTDPVTHADAIAGIRENSFIGSTFARQSPWLTSLIRSGHFKELSLALPITNADALRRRTAEAKGGKVMLSANGELTSSAEAHVERQLSSLHEFLKILVVSILPTLFDRPRAALDWLELARSTIDISERDG
jgi:hypothetical protein